jgi:hypothetical protein
LEFRHKRVGPDVIALRGQIRRIPEEIGKAMAIGAGQLGVDVDVLDVPILYR